MTQLDEAKAILKAFGFDQARCNDRSGRTLLALTQLNEDKKWSDAQNPMLGLHDILEWIRNELDYEVAENTREPYRRQTLHQFRDAGFVIYNDDDPERTTNSSKTNYRINPDALNVIRKYGTDDFDDAVATYLVTAPGLLDMYKAKRNLARIPVTLSNGQEITLSSGGQNVLIKQMIDDFCAYFIPGGEVLYIGDADEKLMHFDADKLASLGVVIDPSGQMPDLVVYQESKNWLFLMEAASTHGPVDAKRHRELKALFNDSTAGLVYVSCFPDRKTMRKFLADLAWESEAWCAEDATHMIHFDGERFLGPYE